MPQSITIACPEGWDLASFAVFFDKIAAERSVRFSAFDRQLQVAPEDLRWLLVMSETNRSADAVNDYATHEELDSRFRSEVRSLRLFSLDFNDVDVARELLRSVAQAAVTRGETLWIDTDYGWVLDARDFLRRIEQDPRWDWRRDPEQAV